MPGQRVTARQLNRATLERQLLLSREPLSAVDALARVLALQAQEPASPYLALWNRVAGFDAADLDTAFADRTVFKASLMRITLHAVTAQDYPQLHNAMRHSPLRGSRLGDPRFLQTGLTADEADALIPDVVTFAAAPRTNAEFEAFFDERFGPLPKPGLWCSLRSYSPVVHAPTGGAWSFGRRPSYVAPGVEHVDVHRDESLQVLARRYLEAFGPASVADLCQFAMITRAAARGALQGQSDLVTLDGPDGELWDVPGATVPDGRTSAPPRLMAMWDSVLLAYSDRSRVIPPEFRRSIIRNNGDTLPTVLADGYVAGVWRPVESGIEITAFQPLSKATWRALEGETAALVEFLADRDPLVYSRYGRWWPSLPAVETRVLTA